MSDLSRFLSTPTLLLKGIAKERDERRLINFVADGWHVLEPGRPFVRGWIIDAICEHLEAVTDGDITRLLVNVPPGSLKSLSTGVFFPAWEWGPQNLPSYRYLTTSYKEDYAKRDARRMRDLVQSPWFMDRWGDRFKLTRVGEASFANDKTGWREALPFASLTAGRGDRVIIDDPHSTEGALSDTDRQKAVRIFLESVPTRVNDPEKSAIIIIMQRLHSEDVSGVALSKELGYEHLCYDDQTEVLARSGWKKFADLLEGEEVMGVDPKSLEAKWEVPTKRIQYRYSGEMIAYKSLSADLVVTPDHRMIYGDVNEVRGGVISNGRVKRAADMPKHFYLPQVVRWGGDRSPVLFAGKIWEPLAFAEFLGWYLSEGYASASGASTRIVQRADGPHVGALERVMRSVPFKFRRSRHNHKGIDVWTIGSKPLAVALASLGKALHKRAPEELKRMAPEYLQAFLMAYALGDGSFSKRNPRKITIATASKVMGDDLQECAVKAGWATSMNVGYQDGGRVFNGYTLPPSTMYRLYLRASKAEGMVRKQASKIRPENIHSYQYDGDVFCVSVPSTGLVVRRNGRIAISGNCIPMEYDPGRHCVTVLGYDSETNEPITWEDPRTEEGELMFPERFPRAVVERDKIPLGKFAVASQFQQMPVPRGGGIIQREWWQLWGNPDNPMDEKFRKFPTFDFLLASVDTAFTEKEENDFSALTVWGIFRETSSLPMPSVYASTDGDPTKRASSRVSMTDFSVPRIMLVAAWHKRLGLNDLVTEIAKTCRKFKVDRLLIENKASGIPAAQEIERLYGQENWGVELIDPKGDKTSRVYAVEPLFSGGMIYAPYEVYDPIVSQWKTLKWVDDVITEMVEFPKGAHDDFCDSTTQAISWLKRAGMIRLGAELSDDIGMDTYNKGGRSTPLYPS